MSEEEAAKVEELYLSSDDLDDHLQAVERELTDRYLDGSLSKTECGRFESFFLRSPARIERLRFARTLKAYGSKSDVGAPSVALTRRSIPFGALNSFIRSYTGIAVSVTLLIAMGIVGWRVMLSRSTERRVSVALTRA